jgi:anti-sigma factor RsiW
MRCADAQELVHAYFDGELDLIRSLEMERHLRECAACGGSLEKHAALRVALRRGGLYETMPATLRARLSTAAEAPPEPVNGHALKLAPAPPETVRAGGPSSRWWMGLAAAVVATAALTWQVVPQRAVAPRDLLADEIINDHVRSLQAHHLTDVETSDRHTVKPWFNGKLDFAPSVQDLSSEGFPLVGGRLDYLTGRPVAALVYRRQKHVINVFAWPGGPEESLPADGTVSQRGYNVILWRGADGLSWCAVSDVSLTDLEHFVSLQRESPPATRAASN